jgi:hypothetical protein
MVLYFSCLVKIIYYEVRYKKLGRSSRAELEMPQNEKIITGKTCHSNGIPAGNSKNINSGKHLR